MATIQICDTCKQPKDTDFRLSLFRQEGKKQKGKVSGDICSDCVDLISAAITASPSNPRPLGVAHKPVAAKIDRDAPPSLTGQIENVLPPLVSDGTYKVPSIMTKAKAREINKTREVEEVGKCKHEKKTMEDTGVICRDCRQPIED